MVWLQYCTIELVKVGSSCSVYEAENGRGGGVLMKLKLIAHFPVAVNLTMKARPSAKLFT